MNGRRSKFSAPKIVMEGRPEKLIAYSMAPFNKFSDRPFKSREIPIEKIGFSPGAAKFSLLFQAAVEFAKSSDNKESLFSEISQIANMSPEFVVTISTNISTFARLRSMDSLSSTARDLIELKSFELNIKPGEIRLVDKNQLKHSGILIGVELVNQGLFPQTNLVDALLELRRLGILRVRRILNYKAGEWEDADNLSSGQLSFFVGLMVLASTITDGSVVLIDEPEISLHPAWQIKYCEILYKIAAFHRNCCFFIATHSPIIISCVDKELSEIYNLGQESNLHAVDVDNPTSIEEIYLEYFDTITPDSYLVKSTIVKAIDAYERNDSTEFTQYKKMLREFYRHIDENDSKTLIHEILKRNIYDDKN
ncbi:hypothetical protein Daqu01_02013 [Deinococcus aquaticus]